jgi:hypothetical protein
MTGITALMAYPWERIPRFSELLEEIQSDPVACCLVDRPKGTLLAKSITGVYMAAAATLVLKNNAATNVNFDPYSVESDSVEWTEAGATSILGTSRFRLTRKAPADKANGVYRIQGKLTRPVVNGTTGALDGTLTFNFELLRPAKLSVAEVDEAVARFKEAVGQSIVKTAAETGAIPT